MILRLTCLLLTLTTSAWAHEPGSYGGVFRSRDLGRSWINADVGLFLNAALVVAINPRDPLHLLVGTELGLLSSRSGGRSWRTEASDLIIGAVFAAAFSSDGAHLSSAASGVFRLEGDRWMPVTVPDAALPTRALLAGDEEFYLLGPTRLFASRDGGRTFTAVAGVPETAEMTALTLVRVPQEVLIAVLDGRVVVSHDGGSHWRDGGLGERSSPVEMVAPEPSVPGRIWAAFDGQIFMSDDLGASWRALGRRLPELGTKVRGVASNHQTSELLVTTDRGTYRSENGGDTWLLKEDNLPGHLEAGPLTRDPTDPRTIYTVYSLIPYSEIWRKARDGGNLLTQVDRISLAGGISLLLLLWIAGGAAAFRLSRRCKGSASAAHE